MKNCAISKANMFQTYIISIEHYFDDHGIGSKIEISLHLHFWLARRVNFTNCPQTF